MAKTYSNSSNANAAAHALAKKFKALRVRPSTREAPGSSRFYPVVSFRGDFADAAVSLIVAETALLVPDTTHKKVGPERGGEKSERIRALLTRAGGASPQELAQTLGWESHTVRAFVSIKNNPTRTLKPWGIKLLRDPTRYVIE